MLKKSHYVQLEDRGVLAISGEDRVLFLQGLVSNNVESVTYDRSVYSALLTPQGKFLYDFFIFTDGDRLLLECDLSFLIGLKKRLQIYRLRSKVELTDVSSEFDVYVGFGGSIHPLIGLTKKLGQTSRFLDGIAFVDPRLLELGVRIIVSKNTVLGNLGLNECSICDYNLLRIKLGVPDGVQDMQAEKTILLEAGFDELNGIDWNKGCYMGQELTARTKYRALIKKRLMPVLISGPLPEIGTPIMFGDKEVGEIRSGLNDVAIASIRIKIYEESIQKGHNIMADSSIISPQKQKWMNF
jgi:folate-binding protein YgfZ